jgi:hypothetical protein
VCEFIADGEHNVVTVFAAAKLVWLDTPTHSKVAEQASLMKNKVRTPEYCVVHTKL